jgi:hypothetical protein
MRKRDLHPNVAIAHLDGADRYVVRPQVKGAAAFEIEAGMMSMTGQDAVVERCRLRVGSPFAARQPHSPGTCDPRVIRLTRLESSHQPANTVNARPWGAGELLATRSSHDEGHL